MHIYLYAPIYIFTITIPTYRNQVPEMDLSLVAPKAAGVGAARAAAATAAAALANSDDDEEEEEEEDDATSKKSKKSRAQKKGEKRREEAAIREREEMMVRNGTRLLKWSGRPEISCVTPISKQKTEPEEVMTKGNVVCFT